jgi:hypothetical protein
MGAFIWVMTVNRSRRMEEIAIVEIYIPPGLYVVNYLRNWEVRGKVPTVDGRKWGGEDRAVPQSKNMEETMKRESLDRSSANERKKFELSDICIHGLSLKLFTSSHSDAQT